ncbi:MAG TPA: type II secretion system F family protein [Microthrixaceae bacterium]|nr:type II secretion system F family protein [Microthrixaceae bacterium]
MMALTAALLSGWLTLRLLGFRFGWPWRTVDLVLPDRRDLPSSGRGPSLDDRSRRTPRPVKRREAHRPSRRQQREVTSALPAAADLLRVAVSAGHSLHGAIAVAAEFGDGPVCDAMGRAHRRFEHGSSLVDEVSALPEHLGPAARAFSATLVMALSSGAPVAPALQRLADAERRRARRQVEERVRRLPVLLLAPLIALVLPAFVILTIVPVVLVTADIDLAGPSPLHASAPQRR